MSYLNPPSVRAYGAASASTHRVAMQKLRSLEKRARPLGRSAPIIYSLTEWIGASPVARRSLPYTWGDTWETNARTPHRYAEIRVTFNPTTDTYELDYGVYPRAHGRVGDTAVEEGTVRYLSTRKWHVLRAVWMLLTRHGFPTATVAAQQEQDHPYAVHVPSQQVRARAVQELFPEA